MTNTELKNGWVEDENGYNHYCVNGVIPVDDKGRSPAVMYPEGFFNDQTCPYETKIIPDGPAVMYSRNIWK